MEKNTNNYFPEIESLRGIAILAVIILHVSGRAVQIEDATATMLIFRTIFALTQFAVPLFLFISGFSLSTRYENNFEIPDFYKNRFKNVLPPYVVFSLLYIITSGKYLEPSLDNLYSVIFMLLFATACIHLWYFRLLFQLYIIYPIIRKIVSFFNDRLMVILIISIVLQIFWVFGQGITDFLLKEMPNLGILERFIRGFMSHFMFSYLSYFISGIYLYKKYNKFKYITRSNRLYFYLLPIIIILGTILSYFHINNLYWKQLPLVLNISLFFNLAIFIILLKGTLTLKNREVLLNRILSLFGRYSFGIFLIHLMILLYFQRFLMLMNIDYNFWYFYIILILLTSLSSLLIVMGIHRLPHYNLLIGKIRTR